MSKKIFYSPLESDYKQIMELVKAERYRSPDTFIDKAIQILLGWESKEPSSTIRILQGMISLTAEQEAFLADIMKSEEKEKHFGAIENLDSVINEAISQERFSPSTHDHEILEKNLVSTKEYIKNLKIEKPKSNLILYDGYPLLFRFYSRFLPAKIVITVLADMLREANDTKIDLKTFRLKSYDIAEEYSQQLQKHEEENRIIRNKKLSTGLPKIEDLDPENIEKKARIQKRFKDQYVGKIRLDRKTKKKHFEGALIALGLIYVEEKNNNLFISLTEKGREFYLFDNPVINGDYSSPLSKDEGEFILRKLLPYLELEYSFIKVVIELLYSPDQHLDYEEKKLTEVIDGLFFDQMIGYRIKNPEESTLYQFYELKDPLDDQTSKKIIGWRVATMGRLSELGVVEWKINKKGDSIYSLSNKYGDWIEEIMQEFEKIISKIHDLSDEKLEEETKQYLKEIGKNSK